MITILRKILFDRNLHFIFPRIFPRTKSSLWGREPTVPPLPNHQKKILEKNNQ